MPREITAFSNPLIKRIRSLREKKHRRAEGLFLAEGMRIVTEAVDAGHLPQYVVYAADAAGHPVTRRIVAAVEAGGGEAIETNADILHKLSGKENPQALLGVFPERSLDLAAIDRASADLWIVAQALRDPGNLGTILRTGDAVGAGGLILIDDCCDPFSVEAVRASMGALFTQKIAAARWEVFLPWLRAGNGQMVGTSLRTDTDYRVPRYESPCFLLMGNESQGLPAAYEDACDLLVKMPMRGRADSLNVAVATGVMAYRITGQRD